MFSVVFAFILGVTLTLLFTSINRSTIRSEDSSTNAEKYFNERHQLHLDDTPPSFGERRETTNDGEEKKTTSSSSPPHPRPRFINQDHQPPSQRPMATLRERSHLGPLLESENFTKGVELGVQKGDFAASILKEWKACQEYVLVDLWAQQTNYKDASNVENSKQEELFRSTKKKLSPWADKLKICRNYTSFCVKNFPDYYFDYIYVDARHDYKGCFEDLTHWWSKLKKGGIMAGHDYTTQAEIRKKEKQMKFSVGDWTMNYDGTRDKTGTIVKGAVDRFFMSEEASRTSHYRQVVVTYQDFVPFSTWYVRK